MVLFDTCSLNACYNTHNDAGSGPQTTRELMRPTYHVRSVKWRAIFKGTCTGKISQVCILSFRVYVCVLVSVYEYMNGWSNINGIARSVQTGLLSRPGYCPDRATVQTGLLSRPGYCHFRNPLTVSVNLYTTYTHKHMYAYTYIHCMHACAQAYVHTHMHACMHNTCKHAYFHHTDACVPRYQADGSPEPFPHAYL
jgi:hypothetical protein